jgi:beta-lactam-binding protein with PASTA domain
VTATFNAIQVQQPQAPNRSPQCVVPNVKRKPLAAAKRRIAAAHCKTGKVTNAKSATVAKGRVISQKLKPGKRLPAGTKINLVVSRGKR